MDELSLALEYEDEAKYINDKYHTVFKNICSKCNETFEADTEDDFLFGRLIKMERPTFPTWNEDFQNIDAYFGDIAQWFNAVNEDKGASGENGLDQLERWMTVKSCKINDKNIFLMAPCHPIVKLINDDRQWLEKKYKESVGKDSYDISKYIKKSVVTDYLRRRESFLVYGTGQVYLSKRSDGCRRAIPWKDVGTLTSIDSLRLIEKTTSWVRRKVGREVIEDQEGLNVRIAYIGTVDHLGRLQDYFEENRPEIKEKEIYVNILFTRLERIPQSGKYVFRRMDNIQEGKRIYDFSSLADMKALFGKFDIILFMDESYFYKQGQTRKNLAEKGAAEYVQWCQKELEWELGSKNLDEEEAKRTKSHFYREIYNKAGLWMNGYGEDGTAEFSFDKDLFGTIEQAAANADCDVYLYISQGGTIGDVDLSRKSICNDERYDGKKLLVYKVNTLSQDDDINDSVEEMLQGSNMLANIDLWKLVKSIGREFSDYFLILWEEQGCSVNRKIALLRKSYLLVNVSKSDGQMPELSFSLCLNQNILQGTFLLEFVRGYLGICKLETDVPYIKNYLYNLLVNAVLSRANSLEGIFYAYLMEQRQVALSDEIGISKDKVNETDSIRIQARRTIYSAIKGLDQIVIRDMEKRWDILNHEFRHSYCKDLTENEFTTLVSKVNDYCKDAGYTDSKLYLLTKPERNIYGQ